MFGPAWTRAHTRSQRASQDAAQPYKRFLYGGNLIRQLIGTKEEVMSSVS